MEVLKLRWQRSDGVVREVQLREIRHAQYLWGKKKRKLRLERGVGIVYEVELREIRHAQHLV